MAYKKNNKINGKKKKYSSQQQKAYHSGMGFSISHHGKKIAFSSEDLKNSFMPRWTATKK